MIIKLTKIKPILSIDGAKVYEIINQQNISSEMLSIAYAVVKPREETKLHTHNFMEVYLIVKGQGVMTLNSETHIVSAGDAVIINPQVKHKIKNTKNENLEFYCVCSPAFSEEKTTLVS
ncbi:MAG: cupin domain-containing protein [Candidatus Odinarchaeia archaeon]